MPLSRVSASSCCVPVSNRPRSRVEAVITRHRSLCRRYFASGDLHVSGQPGPKLVDDILSVAGETGAVAQQRETAGAAAGGDLAGDGEDFAVLLDSTAGRDQGSRTLRRFSDDDAQAETTDDTVTLGE